MSDPHGPALSAWKRLGKWRWLWHALLAVAEKLGALVAAVASVWWAFERSWGVATFCLVLFLVLDREAESDAKKAGLEP